MLGSWQNWSEIVTLRLHLFLKQQQLYTYSAAWVLYSESWPLINFVKNQAFHIISFWACTIMIVLTHIRPTELSHYIGMRCVHCREVLAVHMYYSWVLFVSWETFLYINVIEAPPQRFFSVLKERSRECACSVLCTPLCLDFETIIKNTHRVSL